MGRGEDNLLQGLPASLGDGAVALIEGAASIGGAVLLFDDTDTARWVNEKQHELMPIPSYVGKTYRELFWDLHKAGRLVHAAARVNPSAWIEFALIERASATFTQIINTYQGVGRVAMSNRRLDNGWSIQLRHPIGEVSAFHPEATLVEAVRSAQEAAALRKALEGQSTGVGILSTAGRVLYANGALRDIVAAGRGLAKTASETVGPIHPGDIPSWVRCLSRSGKGGSARAMLRDRGGQVCLAVTFAGGPQPGTVVVWEIALRQHLTAPAADWLEDLGLRAGEIDVLGMLIEGKSTDEIAARRVTARGTVQAQITRARSMLRKNDILADGPGQMIALALQLSAITRAL